VRVGRQGTVAVLRGGAILLLHPDGGGQGRGHAGAETAVRGAEPLRGEAVGPGREGAAAAAAATRKHAAGRRGRRELENRGRRRDRAVARRDAVSRCGHAQRRAPGRRVIRGRGR